MIWNICTHPSEPTIIVEDGLAIPDGYTVEAQTANPNQDVVVAPTRITKFAFRNRFTVGEKVAIELASLDDPTAPIEQRQISAMLRVFIKDLENAQFVQLDRPDIQQGVMQLVALGILSTDRSNQILTTPPEDFELAN